MSVLHSVPLISSGIFAGAAVYITFVEHPARMECGTPLAVRAFGPSYRRASVMQASLAVLGLLTAIVVWLQTRTSLWLIGGLLLGSVVPLTLMVIAPTNRRLQDPSLNAESDEARQLLERWGTLHAVRSVFSSAAFLTMIWAFASSR
jgi:anthrone oxygenase-like protein